MSFDNNNTNLRNTQIYFEAIYREKRKFSFKKTQKLPTRSILNNDTKKNSKKVVFKRRPQKQLSLGPLSSTLESTISSSKPLNDDENSTLSSEFKKNIGLKSKQIIQPVDEDMKFIFDIFFKNRQHQTSINLRQSTKTNYKSQISNDTIDNQVKYFNQNSFNFSAIKKYLVKIQKKYNLNGNIIVYRNFYQNKIKSSGNLMDYYYLQKIEDLISRYSIIIFIFIKCGRIKEAKEIFLLMLKENLNKLNNIEKKVCSKYLVINRRINIYKDIPNITYQLAKIYSFLIKYSQLFNMTNYRNIFIDKYYQILHLNYNFYMIKGNARGFSTETRNQIKYWFSYCLHNTFYYTIYNYFPLRIPIILNYNILILYNNFDENSLTDSEKSLIIKTSFNQGVLYYLNGQKDEALFSLNQAKDKIKSFSDDYYANYSIKNKKSNQNIFHKHVKENIVEIKKTTKIKKKSTINPFKIKLLEENYKNNEKNKNTKVINKKDSYKSLYTNMNNNNIDINDLSQNSDNSKKNSEDSTALAQNKKEELKLEIYKGFKKDKITINDIELLLKFGKEKGLLSEDKSSQAKGLDFLFKYKESFSAIKKKITLPKGFRGSHIDFHTSMKIKDFFVPERFKNPLIRKIELMLCLIELDKNNYEAAYEHVLKVLYIIFLLKLCNYNYYQKDFFFRQRVEINEYFKLIEDSYDRDLKNKQLLEKCSSKSIMTINDRNSLNNMSNLNKSNLNNSLNTLNNSINMFENKENENNYLQNYINSDIYGNNDINNLQSNYGNYNNYDPKIIKEFEKFFIFLNNLSIFQIKILNETQPDNEKRNHLPIMFTNQFKDCLSKIQRIELDNLQTMALSRFIILKDPNKWIIPTNLNYLLIQRSTNPPINRRESSQLNVNRYNYIDDTFMKTKEYKNYLDIINSDKSTPDIKEFLKKNRNYVFKIIKDSNEVEINNIIQYPYVLIDPIRKYKKKIKKSKRYMKSLDAKSRPRTITHSFVRNKLISQNSSSKTNYRISNFGRNQKKYKRINSATEENIQKNFDLGNSRNLNRHKTIENKKNNGKQNSKININIDDLNETFEDYLLSPELSSTNKELNE